MTFFRCWLGVFMRREPLLKIISDDHIALFRFVAPFTKSTPLSPGRIYLMLLQLRHTWKMDIPFLIEAEDRWQTSDSGK